MVPDRSSAAREGPSGRWFPPVAELFGDRELGFRGAGQLVASGEGSALNPALPCQLSVCPCSILGTCEGHQGGVAALYQTGLLEDVAVP